MSPDMLNIKDWKMAKIDLYGNDIYGLSLVLSSMIRDKDLK
jgi:hypothetical protein